MEFTDTVEEYRKAKKTAVSQILIHNLFQAFRWWREKKNESGRRETEKGNKNDFWEICLAPFMFLQRHVSFFGGGGGGGDMV